MTKNDIPIGMVFGQLVVQAPSGRRSGYNRYYLCLCSCGREVEIQGSHLMYAGVTSCRTCAGERRPSSTTDDDRRLRSVWRHMIERCHNPAAKDYSRYGARGIVVDPKWRDDFDSFRTWANQHGYTQGLTLDRINNDAGYSAANCRWTTYSVQNRNSRHAVIVEAFDEQKPIIAWAEDERCVVPYQTLYQRLMRLEWDPVRALTTPSPQSAGFSGQKKAS